MVNIGSRGKQNKKQKKYKIQIAEKNRINIMATIKLLNPPVLTDVIALIHGYMIFIFGND